MGFSPFLAGSTISPIMAGLVPAIHAETLRHVLFRERDPFALHLSSRDAVAWLPASSGGMTANRFTSAQPNEAAS
jgi:hypothetical protein